MITRKAQKYVQFARFCKRYRIDPVDAAELCTLALRVFNQGVKDANGEPNRLEYWRDRFELKAKALRLKVQWSGLTPEVGNKREGYTFPPEL